MQDPVKDTDTDKTEDSAAEAEILTTAKGLGALMGQVPALQQALLLGADRSARREAKRLAARLGENDARVQAARDHAEGIAALRAESLAAAEYGTHAARTLTTENLFHGYVRDAKGAPSKGHRVRLRILDERYAKERLTAETDTSGYFCMELPFGPPQDINRDTTFRGRTKGDVRLGDIIARRIALLAAGTKSEADNLNDVTQTSDQEHYKTEVQILNAAAKMVLLDPEPPDLTPPLSVFRHYVLGSAGKRGPACRENRSETDEGDDVC